MAIQLTQTARALTQKIQQKPQVVLKIDGVDTIFGAGVIEEFIRIGDMGLEIGDDWVIGGIETVADQDDLIDLAGSTSTISQQILQDRGSVNSVSSYQISLIDKNGVATELISPGFTVNEIIGRKATVFLGYEGSAFPQDFVIIMRGLIDEVSAGSTIVLNIAHPEQKKRFEILQAKSTTLTAPVNFRSRVIQSIEYRTRRDVTGTAITVTYTNTGTAGAEVVGGTGNNITVAIESGVTTAAQLRTALEESAHAMALVDISIVSGESATVQTTQSSLSLISDTTINVESTEGFFEPADSGTLTTYIRIDDEIIQYTGKTATTFTGCTREALVASDARAYGQFHEDEANVESFYRLQGDAIDLALKLLLSGPEDYFIEGIEVTSFQDVEGTPVANAIYFRYLNVEETYGLVIGDLVTTIGATDAANNITLREITDIEITDEGSYIIVDGTSLATEFLTTATISFRSQYNVLPDGVGLGLGGDEVDVPEFLRVQQTYFGSIFTYDFYIRTSEQGKEFIDTEILFPTGAYTIPRKGKISVGFTSPPLRLAELASFDHTNTKNPEQNQIKRSISQYFYNNVTFIYNESVLDSGKYLSGEITINEDSKNRIKVGNKPLNIVARGLRPSADNSTIITVLSSRFLDRYRLAAESVQIKPFYGDSFSTDVGDIVFYGSPELKLPNTKKGNRDFAPRLFEVVNKSLNIQTGEVQLKLVDTNYLSLARYGTFGPASVIDSGSTTTEIHIVQTPDAPQTEKDKWSDFYGNKIRVYNDDFSFDEEVTLIRIDPTNPLVMQVTPALSMAPTAGMTVSQPEYGNGDSDENIDFKNQHCFFTPQIAVDSGTSGTEFDVATGEGAKFFVGCVVILHTDDWVTVSPEVEVIGVTGDTIEVDSDLGFTPDNTFLCDLIGFASDEGEPYRYI